MLDLNRRPRMGLLLISPERFANIGDGPRLLQGAQGGRGRLDAP